MALSVFDLYSIGIGPSSSHTVGPMRAAHTFAEGLATDGEIGAVDRVRAELFGSLGATGHGHGSVKAVILGLEGDDPATTDTTTYDARVAAILERRRLQLAGTHEIRFETDDVVMHRRQSLPAHPNGMIFTAYDADGAVLRARTYYSVGGGFVVDENQAGADRVVTDDTVLPYPFSTGAELLAVCEREQMSVSDVMLANELTWRTEDDVRAGLLEIWRVMALCVEEGCHREGVLPGGLRVPRRAPELYTRLQARGGADPLDVMDWVNLYALAVNEQNASGGRVVTAPTNGAAGIVPAVLHYWVRFVAAGRAPEEVDDGIVRFLLTGAAIGILAKTNASISGAEVGCQGEVGSACAMAAGALCEVLGGSPEQVENAAEVGIEHNLGLTCDPVGGLVQIPCIERNAIASVKAINAARLASHGNGSHKVSLDKALKTMRETGADMKTKYKETSRGGLAVNVIEC
ncbi:L-serine ammonia-lyase [Pimelobacter simplex]|uniref:L-serine dehydratase n=1 Tax=Nocardioides simplex TaxID=2045 RepID=A0A0A1DMV7_NOCSI|nr:L-serine ammonia-lyase [Pimelobacter simplex]AIY17942.1 L-serine dehydratase [Pimelobacter simplex]MCG8152650.1 L-serine ammonia-lyase [Pimelobacter simplex]GEB16972.1 L-serine dehydratase [Pimelobacter simplex]SFM75485.1 L-serine ammonia-lyase [Pimelobacter simplex]